MGRKKECLCTTWGIDGENHAYNGCPLHTPADSGVVCASHNISVELADGQGRYMCPECGTVYRITIQKVC